MKDRFSPYPEEKQEQMIQKKVAQVSRQFLEQLFEGKKFPSQHIGHLYSRLAPDQKAGEAQLKGVNHFDDFQLKNYTALYLEMLEQQRKLLGEINHRVGV